MIPFNRACFNGKELTYLAQAVLNGHVSGSGPFTAQAEALLGELHGGSRVILTTSCTHALEMAALLADLEPGDEVIAPSFTFPSTAAAFALHGATPVFVDVDPDTLNMTPSGAAAALSERTKAVCVVHYAGVGADPAGFEELAADHGLVLIEDNAHGLGGTAGGRTLGTFGAMSTLSFHETKNITCGEGGALVLNDPALVERAEILRDKGTNRSRFMRGLIDKYSWVDIGSSWALSDLLAAVLVGQLERFDVIQARRQEIWNRYAEGLSDWAESNRVRLPRLPAGRHHTAHMFHMRFATTGQRSQAMASLADQGVMAVFHYQSLHRSEAGRRLGRAVGDMPVSDDASDTLLRLPLYFDMTTSDVDHVVSAVSGSL